MTKYIALLRGINLGPKRTVLMADLRLLFNELGFTNIRTYIQTGNVLFDSLDNENITKLESKIEKSLLSKYGFEIPVITRTVHEFNELIINNPFLTRGDIERFHLTLLKEKPGIEGQKKISTYDFNPDEFKIIGKNVYVYCSKLYMDTKLGNNFFENKLKVKASTRNWKTILKLSELSKQMEEE